MTEEGRTHAAQVALLRQRPTDDDQEIYVAVGVEPGNGVEVRRRDAGNTGERRLCVLVGDDQGTAEPPCMPAHIVDALGKPVGAPSPLVLPGASAVAKPAFAEGAGGQLQGHVVAPPR